MLSQPSAPSGVGVLNGLGKRFSVTVAISCPPLFSAVPPGGGAGRRRLVDLLGAPPIRHHRTPAAGPDADPDLLGVDRLAGVVPQGPRRGGAHWSRVGAAD